MEICKFEALAMQNGAKDVEGMKELTDLELSIIGGGCGDVTLG
jgi:hypothetical protein